MKPVELRRHCLAQPEAVEEFPFTPDHSVFKVAGKMFALSALKRRPLQISVKCEPELAVQFRDSYEDVNAGWHLNKRHWNTITIGGDCPDKLVRDMIEDSYDLVVDGLPKQKRERLRALR
jgi:predicted DNA-binding protein (MmcQ/YjbR family)